jgi:cupin fold WbuC family metalloprotein
MIDYSLQKIESPEVYLSNQTSLTITASDMNNLVNLAKELPRNRIRYCAHSSPDDVIQEMFIVHPNGAYVRPHKHLNKIESLIILEGEADYVLFDEIGGVQEIISMGDYRSKKSFYQSTRTEQFHSLIIHSKWLVFFEVTQGPFDRDDTVFANWSPVESEKEEIIEFMNKVKKSI